MYYIKVVGDHFEWMVFILKYLLVKNFKILLRQNSLRLSSYQFKSYENGVKNGIFKISQK